MKKSVNQRQNKLHIKKTGFSVLKETILDHLHIIKIECIENQNLTKATTIDNLLLLFKTEYINPCGMSQGRRFYQDTKSNNK